MEDFIRLYTRKGRAKNVFIRKSDIISIQEGIREGYYRIKYTPRGLARPWYAFWIELISRAYILKEDLDK